MSALLGLKERVGAFRSLSIRQQSGSGRLVVIDDQANRLQMHEFPENEFIKVPNSAKGVILTKECVAWVKAEWGAQPVDIEYLITTNEYGLRMDRYPGRVKMEEIWRSKNGECNPLTGLWGIMVETEKMSPHTMVEFLAQIPNHLLTNKVGV